MPLARAVAHVEPRHVHASLRERFQLLEPARGRPDRADQLRSPRAPESVLLQLRFRHGIDVYRCRVRGDRGGYDGSLFRRGGGSDGGVFERELAEG